jgi:putative flippase GtrA
MTLLEETRPATRRPGAAQGAGDLPRYPLPSGLARLLPSRTVLRFGLIGLAGVAINEAVLAVLHHGLAVPLLAASVVATEVAILTNYVGNELWTFPLRQLALGRLLRFQVTALGGMAITALALWALAAGAGLPVLVANLGAVALGAVWNFVGNVAWTWKETA